MQAFLASFLVFFGLLSSQSIEVFEPFPAYLEGREGFVYVLQVDSASRSISLPNGLHFYDPVMAADGSPLYIGRRSPSQASVKISLRRLYEDFLLASQPARQIDYQSKIWPAAAQIRFQPGFLAQLLNDWKSENLKKANGMKLEAKNQSLWEQILFGPELILTAENLKSIRQSDLITEPEPLQLEIPISSAVDFAKFVGDSTDLALHPWAKSFFSYFDAPATSVFDFFWKMSILIQVEELGFMVREKKIVFDAQNNLLRVILLIDKAHISGPLIETGEMRSLFNWRGHEKLYYLERGELSGMQLSIGFELIPPSFENPDFWSLETKKNLVDVQFLDNPTSVSLLIPEKSEEPLIVSLGGIQYDQVLDTLSQEISKAFVFRFFSDQFAFLFEKPASAPGAESIFFKNGVDRVAFSEEDFVLGFHSSYEVPKVAPCIQGANRLESWTYVGQTFSEPKAQSVWGLVWQAVDETWDVARWANSEDAKKENGEFFSSPAQASISHHSQLIDWLGQAFWLAGEFCFDSAAWWPRPEPLPLMKAFLTKPPRVLWQETGEVFFEVEGRLQVFEREMGFDFDAFSRLALSKAFQGRVPISLGDHSMDWDAIEFSFEGLSNFENEFLRQALVLGFSRLLDLQQNVESGAKSIDLIALVERWTEGALSIDELIWSKDQWESIVKVRNFSGFFKKKEKTKAARSHPIPETRFLQPPPYIFDQQIIRLEWSSQPSENITYSWRLLQPNQSETDAAWSPFSSENSIQLILSTEGLYQFEVRGMNSVYEIEYPSNAKLQFYYLGLPQTSSDQPGSSTDVSKERNSEALISKSKETETPARIDAARPANPSSDSIFGCSLSFRSSGAPPVGFWIFLCLFGIGLFVLRPFLGARVL